MCACVSERAASHFGDRCFPVSLSSPLALFGSLSLSLLTALAVGSERRTDWLPGWLADWPAGLFNQ